MSSLANKTVDRALELGRWLIMAGIAYTVVSTAYYFLAGPAQDAPRATTGQAQPSRSSNGLPKVGWQAIAQANLFGKLSKAAPKPAEPVAQEVSRETALPLTLLGVFRADDPKESAAIVAEKGKSGKRYMVGAKVAGKAELVEVHADHIVLRRAGVLEALRFPKSDSMIKPNEARTTDSTERPNTAAAKPSTPGAPAAKPSTTQTKDSTEAAIANFRDRLEDDAASALDALGVEAVSDSGTDGYRLGALANSPLLRNSGLLPGDLLLSVNGQPIGDPSADQLQFSSLLEGGTARMEIQRGKRRFFVTTSLR